VIIKFGYNQDYKEVFSGVLVKQKIAMKNGLSTLEITCKHKAFRMLAGERSQIFTDQRDSDVYLDIISTYGLSIATQQTDVVHKSLVQYKCSDWDFVITCAERNGLLVVTNKDELRIFSPTISSTASAELTYGATLMSFETEIDARQQEPNLKILAWDYSQNQPIEGEINLGDVGSEIEKTSATLARDADIKRQMTHISSVHTNPELQELLKAEQGKRRLSKVRGTATCQGIHNAIAGDTIQLNNIGSVFSGKYYVSGVTHTYADGNWLTTFQVGVDSEYHLQKFPTLPKSSYMIPNTQGLEIGQVTSLDDPEGQNRIQVYLPTFESRPVFWARMARPYAGNEYGVFFNPEIGDEVVIGFLNNDPRAPMILGALHSSTKPLSNVQNDDNFIKGIKTKTGMAISFNEDAKRINIIAKENLFITISDEDEHLVLNYKNNTIEMNESGISLTSSGGITLSAGGDVKITGVNIDIEAQANVKVDGGAGAVLSSSAVTEVKGSLVQIN